MEGCEQTLTTHMGQKELRARGDGSMWNAIMGTWSGLVAAGQPGEPVPSTGSLAHSHLSSCCTSLVFHLLLPVVVMKVL